MAKAKISLIGAGQIGYISPFGCFKNLGDVVIFDIAEGLSGKSLDLAKGACRVIQYATKGTNDYSDIAGSDVCIVTAGVPETRYEQR